MATDKLYLNRENTINLIDRFNAETPEAPFFIWHNFWGPHEPYIVSQNYLDMYDDVEIPPWPNFDYDSDNEPGPHRACVNPKHGDLSWSDWAQAIKHYYAFMTLIDEQIGRILDHLENRSDPIVRVGPLDEPLAIRPHGLNEQRHRAALCHLCGFG